MDENLRQAIVNFLTQIRELAPNPLSRISLNLDSDEESAEVLCVSYMDAHGNGKWVDLYEIDDLLLFLLKANIT